MDILLPHINVGMFPSDTDLEVSLYPRNEDIQVNLYQIGDMLPEEFFPNPNIKKK